MKRKIGQLSAFLWASSGAFLMPSVSYGQSTASNLRIESVSPLIEQPVSRDSSTLFYEDFRQAPVAGARYFEYDSANGSFMWDSVGGYGGTGGMKARFLKGQVAAGSLKVLFGKNPFQKGIRREETFRDLYWRVYVKHEAGWEGNPAKLARATCMAGSDWSQGFIAHVWGGKGDVLGIDPATGITDNKKVTTHYNDFEHLRWLGFRNGQTPIFSPAESGRWVCVESHIRLNSPGKSDGVFELWVDGQREASHDDLDWHGTWDEYAINAVFLENYWNDGAVKEESRWFDEFVIGARPLGPITTSLTPAFTRTNATGITEWQAEITSDAEGQEVAWISPTLKGSTRIGKVGRTALRSKAANPLKPDHFYWLRVRQRAGVGGWSDWSPPHCPFHTNFITVPVTDQK